jgi:hypothetical protein
MSLQATEKECAANAVAPRVSLADIQLAIERCFYFTGGEAARAYDPATAREQAVSSLDPLTICIVVMRNGFSVIGKSAPASPANYNAELGRKLAYEDAVRQIWPLMGFALRDRLAQQS